MRQWLRSCRRGVNRVITLTLGALETWVLGHGPEDRKSPVAFGLLGIAGLGASLYLPWPWATITGVLSGVFFSLLMAWLIFCWEWF